MHLLLSTAIVLFFSLDSYGVLGGKPPNKPHPEIFQIDVRSGDQSRVCTATAISPLVLLTAAHCFDHLQDKSGLGAELFLDGIRFRHKFTLKKHPDYAPRRFSKSYLETSNSDVAVLSFKTFKFSAFKAMQLKTLPKTKIGNFLGTGMRTFSWSPRNGITESRRGPLQETLLNLAQPRHGLIASIPSRVHLRQNRNPTLEGSGQILRSDSGGPLMANGQIIAIARNYIFREDLYNSVGKTMELHHESHFTSLSNKKVAKFLAGFASM